MHTYEQKTGHLFRDGQLVATGYAGRGEGKNNPEMQSVHNIGPLPQGSYEIHGPPFDGGHMGPDVLSLSPAPDNVMFGRSGFFIHADAVHDPGNASEGCIVLDHAARHAIWDSGDHYVNVIAG